MIATVNGQNIVVSDEELTVSQSVGIYECDFEFDSSWEGWDKTAVFEGSGEHIEVLIVNDKAFIPWEVLQESGWIKIGVTGTKDADVKPTIWSGQIYVSHGTRSRSIEEEPTPSIYAQILELVDEAKGAAENVETAWNSVTVSASTLTPGSSATVTFEDNNFAFGIPQGAKGDTGATGATGATPDFSIGTVSTLAAGADATASITGTAAAPVLNLGIPQGAKGDPGDVANLADAYDSTKTYSVGDHCTKEGQYKVCIVPITTAEAWNSAHWADAEVGEEISDLKSALSAIDSALKLDTYDDIVNIVKITSTTTTLGDVATMLNSINTAGDHVFFDMSALGVMMYLCTIFIDTASNVYKVFDLVSGRYAEGAYDATMLLTMATAQANGLAVQSQIDHLQEEIDALGGKSVIENWDALGDMILAGTSPDVISNGDIIDVNWIKSVLGTTTNGLTVTCTDMQAFINGVGEAEEATYLLVYNGTNWTYEGNAISLAEWGLSVSGTPTTGEVMTIKTTVNSVPYTFTSYDTVDPVDENVTHNWLLEQTYAPDTKVYCTHQALFAIYKGKRLPVGNYHLRNYCYRSEFNIDMYLSVTTEIGSDDSIIQAMSTGYNSGVTVTNADGVTKTGVFTVKGLTPIVYGTRATASGAVTIAYAPTAGVTYTELTDLNVDASDPVVFVSNGVFDKCALGSNTWPYSNMSEWLNDDTPAKQSINPAWMLYVPHTYNLEVGFMYGLDPRVKALIKEAQVEWLSGYGNDDFTYNQLYTKNQKVFLLSMKEMSFNIQTNEGEVTGLYGEYTNNVLTNEAVVERVKYNKAGGTLNSYRWSRSAHSSYASNARVVTATGAYGHNYAGNAQCFAPAFIIGKSNIA